MKKFLVAVLFVTTSFLLKAEDTHRTFIDHDGKVHFKEVFSNPSAFNMFYDNMTGTVTIDVTTYSMDCESAGINPVWVFWGYGDFEDPWNTFDTGGAIVLAQLHNPEEDEPGETTSTHQIDFAQLGCNRGFFFLYYAEFISESDDGEYVTYNIHPNDPGNALAGSATVSIDQTGTVPEFYELIINSVQFSPAEFILGEPETPIVTVTNTGELTLDSVHLYVHPVPPPGREGELRSNSVIGPLAPGQSITDTLDQISRGFTFFGMNHLPIVIEARPRVVPRDWYQHPPYPIEYRYKHYYDYNYLYRSHLYGESPQGNSFDYFANWRMPGEEIDDPSFDLTIPQVRINDHVWENQTQVLEELKKIERHEIEYFSYSGEPNADIYIQVRNNGNLNVPNATLYIEYRNEVLETTGTDAGTRISSKWDYDECLVRTDTIRTGQILGTANAGNPEQNIAWIPVTLHRQDVDEGIFQSFDLTSNGHTAWKDSCFYRLVIRVVPDEVVYDGEVVTETDSTNNFFRNNYPHLYWLREPITDNYPWAGHPSNAHTHFAGTYLERRRDKRDPPFARYHWGLDVNKSDFRNKVVYAQTSGIYWCQGENSNVNCGINIDRVRLLHVRNLAASESGCSYNAGRPIGLIHPEANYHYHMELYTTPVTVTSNARNKSRDSYNPLNQGVMADVHNDTAHPI